MKWFAVVFLGVNMPTWYPVDLHKKAMADSTLDMPVPSVTISISNTIEVQIQAGLRISISVGRSSKKVSFGYFGISRSAFWKKVVCCLLTPSKRLEDCDVWS